MLRRILPLQALVFLLTAALTAALMVSGTSAAQAVAVDSVTGKTFYTSPGMEDSGSDFPSEPDYSGSGPVVEEPVISVDTVLLNLDPNGGTCNRRTVVGYFPAGVSWTFLLTTLATCTRANFDFLGWGSTASSTPIITPSITVLTASLQIFAIWQSSAPLSVRPANSPDFTSVSSSSSSSNRNTTVPSIWVPSSGLIGLSNSVGIYQTTSSKEVISASSALASFKVNTNPKTETEVTVPQGLKVSATAPTAETLWSDGAQTASVADGASVYIWGTKTGLHSITFKANSVTIEGQIMVKNRVTDAYSINITTNTQNLSIGELGTATVSVVDVFGNAVAGSKTIGAADTIKVTATGEIQLGGVDSADVSIDANGIGTVSIVASMKDGVGILKAAPIPEQAVAAWVAGYTPPTGAAVPIASASTELIVGKGKTIFVEGDRKTVAGRAGIRLTGFTTGFEDGQVVVPYLRFPGQAGFTSASARPTIKSGQFNWERKTGKRVTVYFATVDNLLKSNRVTIP